MSRRREQSQSPPKMVPAEGFTPGFLPSALRAGLAMLARSKRYRRFNEPLINEFGEVEWNWCRLRDLNPRPTDYKSVALPAELSRPRVCEERYSNVLAFFAESLKNTAPRGETPVLSVHAPRPQAVNRCRSGEIGLLSEG